MTVEISDLKKWLESSDPLFWTALSRASRKALDYDSLLELMSLRKKAQRRGLAKPAGGARRPLRLALVGGYTLYPLSELINHFLFIDGIDAEIFTGDFDGYSGEILSPQSALYDFKPDTVFVIPSGKRCHYPGSLLDEISKQRDAAVVKCQELVSLCEKAFTHSRAEIICANFILPADSDPGPLRAKNLGSEWAFKKFVNLEFGLNAPAFLQICDLEFLAYQKGAGSVQDPRGWFESKQLGSLDFLVEVAKAVSFLIVRQRQTPKKVLVLDLDNTLWGGVIGDDGLDGVELGDTSPRGEAFKAFQKAILALTERGVLLAVCSKNDHEKAVEPFLKHPEMILKTEHISSFKANWGPKSDSIAEIARELNLGLDSFVFVDDNPAEIEIVNQFLPSVETILLTSDPADYVGQLKNSGFFDVSVLTKEDADRTDLYRREKERKNSSLAITDMDQYLESLEMHGKIAPFTEVDVPRLAQLINKSNQFNVTTRRRSEVEVVAVAKSAAHRAFSVRLRDKFGDHGLICVVITEIVDGVRAGEVLIAPALRPALLIDTWLMSCRVLNRHVEQETVNKIVELAREAGCAYVVGRYIPSAKNDLVKNLFLDMGFDKMPEGLGGPSAVIEGETFYKLKVSDYVRKKSKITMEY